jgi:hypothetical protein
MQKTAEEVSLNFMSDTLPTIKITVKIGKLWRFYSYHAKYTCPFYRVPQHGSFITQEAYIGRNTPGHLSCYAKLQN